MPFFQNLVISQKNPVIQLSSSQLNITIDSYFRLISSPLGHYLASISLKRQLSLFDLRQNIQISGFSLQNVVYLAFSQNEKQLVVTSRDLSVKFYALNESSNNKTTISLKKQAKTASSSGWLTYSVINEIVIYTSNSDLYYLSSSTYNGGKISSIDNINSLCAPYYIIFDRSTNTYFSSSRMGLICQYNISSATNSSVKAQIIKSKAISNNYTIGDMGQSQNYVFLNTAQLSNQNGEMFYMSYIIPKNNFSTIYSINLTPLQLVPGPLILSQNVYDYVLLFIKGESNLYVYSLLEAKSTLNKTSGQILLSQSRIIQMPFNLQAINYNQMSNKLVIGVTGQMNIDKIAFIDFKFNCSSVSKNSKAVQQFCNNQCQQEKGNNTYFSYNQGKCLKKSSEIVSNNLACLNNTSKGFQWNQHSQQCQLNCSKVKNSYIAIPFNSPSQCVCSMNYFWYKNSSQCLTQKQIDDLQSEVLKPIKPVQPISPFSQPSVPSSSNIQTGLSTGSIVAIIVTVIILISLIILAICYKFKKLCFKQQIDQIQTQQELKQSDIATTEKDHKSPTKESEHDFGDAFGSYQNSHDQHSHQPNQHKYQPNYQSNYQPNRQPNYQSNRQPKYQQNQNIHQKNQDNNEQENVQSQRQFYE